MEEQRVIESIENILENDFSYCLISPGYLPIVEQCKNCKQFCSTPLDDFICDVCNHKSRDKTETKKHLVYTTIHNWLCRIGYNFKSGSFLCLNLLDDMLKEIKGFYV